MDGIVGIYSWFADGGIEFLRKNDKIYKRFILYNTDIQIMEMFKKVFDDATLRNHISNNSKKKCVRIVVYSECLFDFCYSLIGSTDKSHSLFKLPNLPSKMFHHFVRGFFDGDGSIYWRSSKSRHGKITKALQTSFTGGCLTNHIEELRDYLHKNVGLGNKKISGKQRKKLIYNQYDSMLLCEWMYKNATVFMQRKKQIWDAVDREKIKMGIKFFSNKV